MKHSAMRATIGQEGSASESLRFRHAEPGDRQTLHHLWEEGAAPSSSLLFHARPVMTELLNQWEVQSSHSLWVAEDKAHAGLLGYCGFKKLDHYPIAEFTYGFRNVPHLKKWLLASTQVAFILGFHTLNLETIFTTSKASELKTRRKLEYLGLSQRDSFLLEGERYLLYSISKLEFYLKANAAK